MLYRSRLAKKNGYAESNPAKELEQEKHQKPPIDPFTSYEKETILSQLDGQALVYFTLAFETGARTSELLALTWNDYDGKRLAINKSMVRREVKLSTKTNMAREVLLTQRSKAILRECPTRFKGGPILRIRSAANVWMLTTLTGVGEKHSVTPVCAIVAVTTTAIPTPV